MILNLKVGQPTDSATPCTGIFCLANQFHLTFETAEYIEKVSTFQTAGNVTGMFFGEVKLCKVFRDVMQFGSGVFDTRNFRAYASTILTL